MALVAVVWSTRRSGEIAVGFAVVAAATSVLFETVAAVDGLVACGAKGDLAVFATTRTSSWVHLAILVVVLVSVATFEAAVAKISHSVFFFCQRAKYF